MSKFILILIIFAHIFILSKLIFFPYPELFIYPYLTNHGLKPYAQILDQHFPGLLFLPINFDNLGMNDEVSARLWLFGIVFLTHILLFLISRSILDEKKALLVNLLYIIWQPFFEGWVLWIDNFLPLLLLTAFLFIIKKRFFLAGIFLGIAIVFKQTVIPLAALLFFYFLLKKDFKIFLNFALGVVFPVGLMLAYIISKGIFADFWYWTVVFNLTTYAQFGTQIPKDFGFLSRIIFVYGASLPGFLHGNKNQKIILGLFFAGSLIGAFDRANFVHFQPSLPFAVLLTALGFYSINRVKVGLALVGVYLSVTIWWQNVFYIGHISDKVFFFDSETYDISNKIREYTNEGDKIYVYAAAPHLYQMSKTLPAGDIFVFQFPWFLKVAEERILEGIKKDRVDIIVSDKTVKIDGEKVIDFTKSIYGYISENYEKIDSIGSTEILKKKIKNE